MHFDHISTLYFEGIIKLSCKEYNLLYIGVERVPELD
jgi:hypothetical protein